MGLKVCQLCAVDFTLKNFLLPLVDGMRGAGWDVVSVCSDGSEIQKLRGLGYSIETIKIERSFNLFRHARSFLLLVKFFKSEDFDVVHVHTPIAALIGRVAASVARVPLIVYTAHGFYFHDDMPPWKRAAFVWLEKLGSYFTDMLFTQSEEDATTARLEGLGPKGKIYAIGNGVNPEKFNPSVINSQTNLRSSLRIPEDAFVIGFIGRLVREKGIEEFLAAAKIIARRYPDVYFLVVGERLASDHASGVGDELSRALGELGSKLILLGLRDDIPQCLAALDLFCLPSWREGMPRTIIEAMMMAKPVLATNIRGSREEVIGEVTGLLTPARSPQELAEAMARFVENPEWSRKLGAAGRDRALSIYDEGKIINLQINLIEKELSERGYSSSKRQIFL